MPFAAIELAAIDPVAAFAVFERDSFALLLDSCGDGGEDRARYSYVIAQPCQHWRVPHGCDPFPILDRALSRRPVRPAHPDFPPFQGGLVGWMSYESGGFLEDVPMAPAHPPLFPTLFLASVAAVLAWDHRQGRCWAMGEALAARSLARRVQAAPALCQLDWRAGCTAHPDRSQQEYCAAVQKVIDLIYAGDIFQANLTQSFTAPLPPDLSPSTLYRRMRHLAPAPFAALLQTQQTSLCSVSPERFITMDAHGWMETRPIKGSRARGNNAEQDQALAADLAASVKDRAENLMILDLMRNDFARVCQVGSVQAPQRMALESFPAIHHLVSVVTGRIRPDHTASHVLRATFPPGSITGAPKIRAMDIIAQLESRQRGPYCGVYGWFGDDGAMDLAVAIRIAACQDGTVVVHAGGGITADSKPEDEYWETMVKAAPILAALRGERTV